MDATDLALGAEHVGFLEVREFNRARWAYDLSHPGSSFMQWLGTAGHVNFNITDVRVNTSSVPAIPIPATKLAWMEINRLSNLLQQWPDVEAAAHDKIGASHLLDLGREVSNAYRQWPDQEKPHKVTAMRCGGCGLLTLTYRPPRFEGDDTMIDCPCGYALNDDGFAWAVDMIEKEEHARRLGERKRRRTA